MKSRSYLWLASVLWLLSTHVHAFKPTADEGHAGFTRIALKTIDDTRLTNGEIIVFSDNAIEEIVDANQRTDDRINGEFFESVAHCDDEQVNACNNRLISLRQQIIQNVKTESSRNGAEARRLLGRALHTIQDFYSHSNWVSNPGLNEFSINADLGIRELTHPVAKPGDATCAGEDFDALDGAGLTKLTSGYFPLTKLGKPPQGKCIHGIVSAVTGQGSGIHQDLPSRNFFFFAKDQATQASEAYVRSILRELRGFDPALRELMRPGGDVAFVIDVSGSMGTGLEGVKRTIGKLLDYHETTKAPVSGYVLETFADNSNDEPLVTSGPLRTESISAFRAAIDKLSVLPVGGDCPELPMGALMRTIDIAQAHSKIWLFTDASSKDSALLAKVKARANAKSIAISFIVTGSCSPIDPAYFELARDTGGSLTSMDPSRVQDAIDLVDPYLGEGLNVLARGVAAAEVFPPLPETWRREIPFFVDSSVSQLTASMSSIDGTIDVALIRPDGVEVTEAVGGQEFAGPSGKSVTLDNPIENLPPGATGAPWKLIASSNGPRNLSYLVTGRSSSSMVSAQLVERRGREGHSGLLPVEGKPLANQYHKFVVTLSDDLVNRIEDAGDAGKLLAFDVYYATPGSSSLGTGATRGGEDLGRNELVGRVALGTEQLFSFWIWAVMLTEHGVDVVQRGSEVMYASPVRVRAVDDELRPLASSVRMNAGETSRVFFEVEDVGEFGTGLLEISIDDRSGIVADFRPKEIKLDAAETRIVTVELLAPEGMTGPAEVILTARETSPDVDESTSPFLRSVVENSGSASVLVDAPPKQARGDMDGDQDSDVLMRHQSNGGIWLYRMLDGNVDESLPIGTVGNLSWEIVGTGDYNGDRMADILWRNSKSAAIHMWLMSGKTPIGSARVAPMDDDPVDSTDWSVACSSDFDGDGNDDIYLRNVVSGRNHVYLMSGSTVLGSHATTQVSNPTWQVAGCGDFDADGRSDVFWRNVSSGRNHLHRMRGARVEESVAINSVSDLQWQPVAFADYDGNKTTDVVWRHAGDGRNFLYLMDGAQIALGRTINRIPDADWKIVGSGDYNGDGMADILMRNFTTGARIIYLMNGAVVLRSESVRITKNLEWGIVNTK